MPLSLPFFLVLLVLVLLMALVAPLASFLYLDLVMLSQGTRAWTLGGLHLDPSDLTLFGLGIALLLRGRIRFRELRRIPFLIPWTVAVVFLGLSYVASPDNAENLTNPLRAAYQIFRYCVKPLLFYPLAFLLLRTPRHGRAALVAVLIGADLCAIQAIQQGFANVSSAPGPFAAGNGLGSALIIPFLIALAGTVFPNSRWHWAFSFLSLGLVARALLFSASRGAMVAVIFGVALFVGLLFLVPAGRWRLVAVAPLAALVPLFLLMLRPDILERPSIQHAFSIAEGHKAKNMQWRIIERWPHFYAIAREHPWVGTGSAVDESLGKRANTPHNGYLALAVRHGFIVPVVYLLFLLRMLRDSLLVFRRSRQLRDRVYAVALAAGACGLMVHNLVETTLTIPVILKLFWLCCALAAVHAAPWKTPAARRAWRLARRARWRPQPVPVLPRA